MGHYGSGQLYSLFLAGDLDEKGNKGEREVSYFRFQ